MIELLVAGTAGVVGHMKSRGFVKKRLRFTGLVDKPGLGLMAGAAAAVVTAPLVAVLPIVGATTAIIIGAGVGTGVALGAKDARTGRIEDD